MLRHRHIPLRRGGTLLVVLSLILLSAVGIGGWIYYRNASGYVGSENAPILETVFRGDFDHIVLEQGEVGSSSNNELKCQVKARGSTGTPILWVIDEGTYVKKGDKLCELDSSALENEIKGQRIVVSAAEALVISSDAAVRQAAISRQEYLEGIYQTDRKLILSEIAIAEQERRRAELSLASAERLAAKGTLRPLQIQAEQFSVQNAKNVLESAKSRLRVLDELTKQKMLVQLDSSIETARAKLESDRSVLLEEKLKLDELQQQISWCTIIAPANGQVVHANAQDRRGNAEFIVAAGSIVREQQNLFLLPDPTKMQVRAKINESRITLIREGMPVKIQVQGANLLGQVSKVNKYAEAGGWLSTTVKEYVTAIEIYNPPPTIRTGMTAEVQIFVEQIPNALQIPVHAVYESRGHYLVLRKSGPNKYETVEVEVGATNERFVTVNKGLSDGDQIVVNPRQHEYLMNIPEFADLPPNEEFKVLPKFSPSADSESAGPRGGSGPDGAPGGSRQPAEMVKLMMDRLDTDHDGKISSDEAAVDDRMSQRFASQDANGDGFVEEAELLNAMQKRATQGLPGGPPK